ncbi:MAG: hypothetical protein HXY50_05490 [Ignavibacteriaceae bacterium]|nr:hypothetical protein [Ignavibacteriaceae bacterium]
MKPIWYFVGLILLVIGGILLLTGLYMFLFHSESKSVLSSLHPNIWWGATMLVVGLIFIVKNRNITID